MSEPDDENRLRRYYASLSDEALAEAHAEGEASYQPAAWVAIVVEMAARSLEAPSPVQEAPSSPAPPEDPQEMAALDEVDRNWRSRQPAESGNPVLRLWRGDVPLWFAYWVLFVGGAVAWRLIFAMPWPRAAVLCLVLVYLPYGIIVCMGLWSSTERYQGPYPWLAALARVQAAFGVIGVVASWLRVVSGPE